MLLTRQRQLAVLVMVAILGGSAAGQGWNPRDLQQTEQAVETMALEAFASGGVAYFDPDDVVPQDQRTRFRNPDGSCVQCSIGIAGVHHNCHKSEMLLWNSEYGPPVRGGSTPARVRAYAEARGIPMYNVTGSQTMDWIEWALSTGRHAALTFKARHMCTAVGMSHDRQTFYVVDNNSPQRVDRYSRAEFLRLHKIHGGGWVVILKGPAPAPWVGPEYREWWE
jgi:hypothetical protein